jgi:ribosomal-protein-alanine N-acetyltransferase
MKHSGTNLTETSRLLLRPFALGDCDDMLENWVSNPKVQSEYGEPTYSSEYEVVQLLEKWIKQYENLDFYRWAIIEKQSQQNIGQIAFCKVYSDCLTAEIEYCIGENFWGNGYAGEALDTIIDYTFTNTEFNKLEAFHREANQKSGKVLEKSKMTKTDNVERFIRENKSPHGEVCYAIVKDDYLQTK